ncbi:membrane protein [Skermanella stibiiresistens SB22]|uniref:Membrane protein n=1 Tax=Skermanella stibiiresistens SB22 TaxID=1385369 RepID=W9H1H8_9PROT|nr:DedA family protein [Skermanella stibiiresistens]EWY39924.1 membrane protein [Skermanella stibiiresistens SB22]
MEIIELINRYGDLFYGVVAVWTFLEGETIVIFSGIAARQGALDLMTLISCAWIGSFLGDQMYFMLGRHAGTRMLNRYPRWRPGVDKALGLLEKYSTAFILSFRFVYGVRNFSSFAMGMSTLSWRRFALLNFFAAGIWAVCFAGAGYAAGAALQQVAGELATTVSVGLLCLFILVGGLLGLRSWRRKRAVAAPALIATVKEEALALSGDERRP